MKKFFILLLFFLTTNNVYALSIIYDGNVCTDEPTRKGVPAQSIFTIEEDLGNGNYKLSLEQGYLVFRDQACLELIDTTVDPSNLSGLSKIKATGYFNGNTLVISYGLIRQNKDIVSGTPILLTDINFPSTYTLVFDYLPSIQAFKLKSVAKLDNLFTALSYSDTKQSFSSSHVELVFPIAEIQFLLVQ
jgi:hypothetical protein